MRFGKDFDVSVVYQSPSTASLGGGYETRMYIAIDETRYRMQDHATKSVPHFIWNRLDKFFSLNANDNFTLILLPSEETMLLSRRAPAVPARTPSPPDS